MQRNFGPSEARVADDRDGFVSEEIGLDVEGAEFAPGQAPRRV
jgi:hypothetical protein